MKMEMITKDQRWQVLADRRPSQGERQDQRPICCLVWAGAAAGTGEANTEHR